LKPHQYGATPAQRAFGGTTRCTESRRHDETFDGITPAHDHARHNERSAPRAVVPRLHDGHRHDGPANHAGTTRFPHHERSYHASIPGVRHDADRHNGRSQIAPDGHEKGEPTTFPSRRTVEFSRRKRVAATTSKKLRSRARSGRLQRWVRRLGNVVRVLRVCAPLQHGITPAQRAFGWSHIPHAITPARRTFGRITRRTQSRRHDETFDGTTHRTRSPTTRRTFSTTGGRTTPAPRASRTTSRRTTPAPRAPAPRAVVPRQHHAHRHDGNRHNGRSGIAAD